LVLVDRSVEAIHFFKILTNPTYAAKKAVKSENTQRGAEQRLTLEFKVEKNEKLVVNNQLSLLALVQLAEDQTLQKITITENKDSLSTEAMVRADSANITLKNVTRRMTIEKSAVENQFDVVIELADEINLKAGKSLALATVQFSFKPVADILGDDFQIMNLKMSHQRAGVQVADFAMQSGENTLVANINENCASISGAVKLNSIALKNDKSGPLYYSEISYASDSAVSVKNSGKDVFNSPAAVCSERALVDISKLL
jgi:hypothetical protein